MNHNSPHTPWCAKDHRCAVLLGEHRAREIVIDSPGAGRALLTRVLAVNGKQHAEIRLRIVLPANETAARNRLAALLTHLQTLIGPSTTTKHPVRRAA